MSRKKMKLLCTKLQNDTNQNISYLSRLNEEKIHNSSVFTLNIRKKAKFDVKQKIRTST